MLIETIHVRSYSSPKCCGVIWNSLFTADIVGRSKKNENRTDIRYFKNRYRKTDFLKTDQENENRYRRKIPTPTHD